MTRPRLALAVLVLSLGGVTGCVVVESEVPVGGGRGEAPAPQEPPAGEPSGDGAGGERAMAREIFDRVNAERAERGLAPVEWNDDLAAVAGQWSREMAQRGALEHQDPRQLLQREELAGLSGVGENVFRSTGPVSAGRIHEGWMRSDGHRVNVVNPGWDRLGVGVFCADDGSVWATQQFGRTAGSDRPPVAEETPPQRPVARPEPTGPSCP